ncbi:MAG: hypothetical protein ACXVC6_13390 [Bacteroidia bacterium]
MVKKILMPALLLIACKLSAQDSTSHKFRYQSILKGDATISPGYLLNSPQTNIYIDGTLEYFTQDRVSLRGEGFLFVGAQNKPALMKENSSLLYGAAYHFHKNRLDFFVGLEVGASITKPNDVLIDSTYWRRGLNLNYNYTESYDYKILPVISPVTGITFYPSNYFNFFLNVHYFHVTYYGYTGGKNLSLDELRISAGLGFQIHVRKPH